MSISNKIIGNILGKPRVRGGKNDWDGDGVLNKKDCQPRNTMRQDRKDLVVKQVGSKYMLFDTSIGSFLIGYTFDTSEEAQKFAKG